jgi:hypothetical protein
MGQLRVDKVRNADAFPCALRQQIMTGRETDNALAERVDELARVLFPRGVKRDRLHDGQQVLGTMIELAHEKLDMGLDVLSPGDVLQEPMPHDGPIGLMHGGGVKFKPDLTSGRMTIAEFDAQRCQGPMRCRNRGLEPAHILGIDQSKEAFRVSPHVLEAQRQ